MSAAEMQDEPLHILVVDDSDDDSAAVRRHLERQAGRSYAVEVARTCAEAEALCAESWPDCMLMDFHLPDGDALELISSLHAAHGPDFTSIIVVTGQGSEALAVASIKQGACDYLPKSQLSGDAVGKAIDVAMEATRRQRGVSEERQSLERMAFYDSLTGLANRNLFSDRLARAVSKPGQPFSTMLIDLDGFKAINDTYGHAAGDAMLRETGQRLRDALGQPHLAARLGGDEFGVLVRAREDEVVSVAHRLHLALQSPVTVGNDEFAVGASVGVAHHPAHGRSARALLAAADAAMYRAKIDGVGVAVATGENDGALVAAAGAGHGTQRRRHRDR